VSNYFYLIFDSITFPEEYVEGLDGILGEYEFFNIKIKGLDELYPMVPKIPIWDQTLLNKATKGFFYLKMFKMFVNIHNFFT